MAELITQRANELATLALFADCFGADLYGLALLLEPVRFRAGDVLMRQGEQAHSFYVIAEGDVAIRHENDDGSITELTVPFGQIVGEIALLRNGTRVATVVATTDVRGWRGGDEAFGELVGLPGVLPNLVRLARQRLAAFITPVPIRLKGAHDLLLRPVLPGDSERTSRGHVEFSAETVYRRFMSVRKPNKALMDYLFQVDYVDHFVWVVLDPCSPDPESREDVIADARFIRDPAKPTSAEVAFIVADAYQGQGIGTFLMKALAVAAQEGGVEEFTATVLAENLAMRRIFDSFGASWQREDLGVVMTVIQVPDRQRIRLPKKLIEQIAVTARQVLRAVG
ncbi:GNAT family N-acetyltransferase [Mycobacterium sp. ACS4331]|uniref:GNAT family N-acetyltransferase n=1 Tax=Mycobacterium sp. ACS4331 TaxID=1834121 RepID=UPI0007FFB3D0|nr:GNAT family N-acetyltransferase [Mycobacterium sp. ACS4331]OBF19755.1 acetyltransferase [Mycobacterium sp. ACS4331]